MITIKNIKNTLQFGLSFIFILCFAQITNAQEFIEGFEDIPIMSGLSQMPNDNISFGNDESRLVEAYLSGKKVVFEKVAAFYIETLPQLGWHLTIKNKNNLTFSRDEDILDIVCEQKKPLLVRITLKSKN